MLNSGYQSPYQVPLSAKLSCRASIHESIGKPTHAHMCMHRCSTHTQTMQVNNNNNNNKGQNKVLLYMQPKEENRNLIKIGGRGDEWYAEPRGLPRTAVDRYCEEKLLKMCRRTSQPPHSPRSPSESNIQATGMHKERDYTLKIDFMLKII